MIRRAALALVLIACGSKKAARDCDAYAEHVADLSDPAPGRRDMVVSSSRDRCERGRVSDRELACVGNASMRSQLIECVTGRPATDASLAPPPPPKRTNAVTLVTVQNGEGFKPLDVDMHEDQRAWIDGVKKDIAACATDELYEPQQYVVIVIFSPEPPAISLGGLPRPLSFCVQAVLQRRQPSSVGNGPAEFIIDVGR